MMFQRFTQEAREAVIAAESEASALGARAIEPEHLLLALAASAGGRAHDVLASLGFEPETLREELRPAGGRDAEALATIGIDLDEVRRRTEENFGPGAFDRALRQGKRAPFAKEAKRVLERTLRHALALGDRELNSAHMLLAVADDDRAAAALARQGIGTRALRDAVLDELGRGGAAA